MPELLLFVFVALLGACVGSFAALIIFRWPKEISIVSPRSFCYACKKNIKLWHNIPVISSLILRARCAYCRVYFGYRLLIIELIFMLAFVALYAKFGLTLACLERAIITFLLIAIAYIDLDTFYLPLSMLAALALWALFFTGLYFYFPDSYIQPANSVRFLKFLILNLSLGLISDRLLGGFFGMVFFSLLNIIATYLLRKNHKLTTQQWAMGWGDPLLLMSIGFFVGLSNLVLVIFLASSLGALTSILNSRVQNKLESLDSDIAPTALPYGPFLAIAALYVYLF